MMKQKPKPVLKGCCQGVSRSDVLPRSIGNQIKRKDQKTKVQAIPMIEKGLREGDDGKLVHANPK